MRQYSEKLFHIELLVLVVPGPAVNATSNFHLFAALVLVAIPSRATTFVADTIGTQCAGDLVES